MADAGRKRTQRWVAATIPEQSEGGRQLWTQPQVSQTSRPAKRLRTMEDNYASPQLEVEMPAQYCSYTTETPSRHATVIQWTTDLRQLEKPVEFRALDDDATPQLPADVEFLYNRIYEIAVEHKEIFDYRVRETIICLLGREPKDEWFTKPSPDHLGAGKKDSFRRLYQTMAVKKLKSIEAIRLAARLNMMLDDPQLQWYQDVFQPLTQSDFLKQSTVLPECLANERIDPAFYPIADNGKKPAADTEMDCALIFSPDVNCQPAKEMTISKLIHRCVNTAVEDVQHVNATNGRRAQYQPIAVHVASTFSEAPDQSRARLGVWAAAWYCRMRALFDSPRSRLQNKVRQMVTLPLIHVVEHEWKLLFAYDKGNHIEVVYDISIGDTRTIFGLHTLVAVLAELASWIDTVFAKWIQDSFSAMLR